MLPLVVCSFKCWRIDQVNGECMSLSACSIDWAKVHLRNALDLAMALKDGAPLTEDEILRIEARTGECPCDDCCCGACGARKAYPGACCC